MAFATIAAENTATNTSSTSHNVNLPAGIASGNLLIVIFGGSAAATTTWPAGWNKLAGGATGATLDVGWKLADGSEASTISVSTGATSITSQSRSYRITGGDSVVLGTNVTIANNASGDPPSLTPGFSGSALDILWFAISFASTQTTVSTYPTSFTNTAVLTNGSTGLATCNRPVNGTVLDPAAFTWGGTGRKNTNTVAVRPGNPKIADPADDPWANLADTTLELDLDHYLLFSDPWLNLDDTDGVAYSRPAAGAGGTTPKTANVPAESFNTWAESLIAARSREATGAVDAWGNLSDTAALFDKPTVTTTPKTATPPADANAAYTERLGLGIGLRDDAMAMADATPVIDRASLTAAIEKNVPTIDNLAAYGERLGLAYLKVTDGMTIADTPVTLIGDHLLTFSEAWGTLGDTAAQFNKGTTVSTPITRNVPADANADYAEQLDIVRTSIYYATPDDLNLWGEKLGLGLGLRGDAMVMADAAPVVSKPSVGVTPITRNVPEDANVAYGERLGLGLLLREDFNQWADSRSVSTTGFLAKSYNVPADDFAGYADPLIAAKSREATAAPDNLHQWLDSSAGGTSLITTTPKTANVPAESYNNWSDALSIREVLLAAPDADTMLIGMGDYGDDEYSGGVYGPDLDTIALQLRYYAQFSADNLGGYVDQPAQVNKSIVTTPKIANVPPDANVAYGERLGRGVGAIDNLASYAERLGLGISLRGDDLANYVDPVQFTSGGNLNFNIAADSLQQWADSLDASFKKFLVVPADSMAMGDQPAAYTRGQLYPLTDPMPTYGERLGIGRGLIDAIPTYIETTAVGEFGFLRVSIFDQNDPYFDSLNLLYLGFDQKAVQITDSMVNWDDAAAAMRALVAIKLSGKVIDQISLTGAVIEEQVSLNGKAGDQADLSGELYTGES